MEKSHEIDEVVCSFSARIKDIWLFKYIQGGSVYLILLSRNQQITIDNYNVITIGHKH